MATKININRLDEIHSEMENLLREATRIVTDAVGRDHIVAARADNWKNNIKYALTKGDPCHNTSMFDTLETLQEMIEDGELEEDWGDDEDE